MKTPLDAFLEAIREEPDKDDLRLIFADWLEDRGDARGTLMRMQVRRSHLPPDAPEWRALERQERQLLASHAGEWLGPLRNRIKWWQFRRGLLQIQADVLTFLDAARAAGADGRAFAWVERLILSGLTRESLAWLLSLPYLSYLTSLELWGDEIGDAGAELLARCPRLARLTSLRLNSTYVGPAGAAALAGSAHLGRLTVLGLYNNPIGPAGAKALAASPSLARLTELWLGHTIAADAGAASLARSEHLAGLTVLDLCGNDLGDGGAIALAVSPVLRDLTWLNLGGNRIGEAGAAALAASPHLSQLTTLHLEGNLLHRDRALVLRQRWGTNVVI